MPNPATCIITVGWYRKQLHLRHRSTKSRVSDPSKGDCRQATVNLPASCSSCSPEVTSNVLPMTVATLLAVFLWEMPPNKQIYRYLPSNLWGGSLRWSPRTASTCLQLPHRFMGILFLISSLDRWTLKLYTIYIYIYIMYMYVCMQAYIRSTAICVSLTYTIHDIMPKYAQ